MKIAVQTLGSTPSTDRRLGEVHFDDIVAARRLLARELAPTPLVTHPLLSRRLGAEAHVKLENALPLGSFKLRGGLNFVGSLDAEQRKRGLATATRGNHGQSLAYAAQRAGVRCQVFVPAGNNPDSAAAIAALGAEVTVAGHDFDAAWDAAVESTQRSGAIAVHPSREPKLIAGYATVALELIDQAAQPFDTLILPVGGGSLAAGVGLVFKALSPHTRVVGVQAAAAPALARAWRTGQMTEVPVGDTIADGLAARVPSPDTVAVLREVLDDVLEVSEAEIAGAIRCLAETVHQLAEGAGAAALAGALQLRRRVAGQRVGIVLSGGNIPASLLTRILHGELQGPAAHGAQLSDTLADMEYGQ
jgi:threonine dehydratase